MITEQQLKADCTPKIIKKMVELAEGFEFVSSEDINLYQIAFFGRTEAVSFFKQNIDINVGLFPLLIHRAVEGWNRLNKAYIMTTDSFCYTTTNLHQSEERRDFKNYQPTTLTHAECAMLDCLLYVLEEK